MRDGVFQPRANFILSRRHCTRRCKGFANRVLLDIGHAKMARIFRKRTEDTTSTSPRSGYAPC